ncbi:mannose-1-phosphate guanylyltransferase/mannose-6-phosphate isomerase [Microvirga tunisiensis]|uniref:mannose-1-phosphate guanylyltransferase n=1 Tax=Microvirga tunisiensis TaxID=2108360 RepID=A0A5N7MRF0_9HYPH|nr:mannose-1-phosphate guanylyltransferase/mannose-6-phosphate isomerase [Microvirga tunisiensis]MPR11568.1 mannose-1-phosphate guanylyltransferase/mannose-6-phosphate isomerase [Microvirga tunisiensis]MPR29582.1 mannose-1-phosphate guanylyltransferase/mannose-6-phosphate isomerase [Microvirga tunisiensis]
MSEGSIQILPVVMCGGSGTRLWPASRDSMPKQFIDLIGQHSTFQTAIQRVTAPQVFQRPAIISSNDVRFIVAEQLAQIGVQADIILEPIQRDSAAAIAVAACHAARVYPEAIVLVIAADHVVEDVDAFVTACQAAIEPARQGHIMTLGVVPQYPATSYGYIQPGKAIKGTDANRVDRFVEKPNAETALTYIDQGFLWNSGNFLFRADVMIEELERFQPAILAAARDALERATIDLDFIRLDEEAFKQAPKTSIDYAVMERTERAGVLPVSFSWSDIGTWGALWDASPRDHDGNAVRGNVEVLEARNSLIHSDDILTTVVGLEDVVVVAKPDAVLVTSRNRSELVKDLVVSMKAKQVPEATEHLRMYRPWGWYQRIDRGSRFQVKRIMVKPGGRLSLQKHHHRAEHWVVVRGTAEVVVNQDMVILHENESVYIPIGAVHRLTNPGRIPLELIEVQVGSYTGEDDIIRVEDVYGR